MLVGCFFYNNRGNMSTPSVPCFFTFVELGSNNVSVDDSLSRLSITILMGKVFCRNNYLVYDLLLSE